MIIPIGHRSMRLAVVPWAAVAVFVLCVIVFGLTRGVDARADQRVAELFGRIGEVYLAEPSLEIDPKLQELLLEAFGVDENQREVFLASLQERAVLAPAAGPGTSQAELDVLTREFWSTYRGSPSYRLGVVPTDVSAVDLLTYQFMHAGWAHLIGNLLLLYLAAPHLEQRWGRPVFVGFYLVAGIVAALFWALRYPELELPLVGASGAIAGLMGAFLICFGTSKIRFFYWFFVVWGTFEAPAWLMLPLWLAMEVILGRSMDVMGQSGGGVAHWAHVWGFIFGMVVAWVMSVVGVDALLARRGEIGGAGETAADHMLEAHRMVEVGRVDEAVDMLRKALSRDPSDVAAAKALWSICVEHGRAGEAIQEMLGVIRRAARHGEDALLVDSWQALLDGAPDVTVDPLLAHHVMDALDRHQRTDLSAEVVRHVDRERTPNAPWQALAGLASRAAESGLTEAGWLAEAALASAELPAEERVPLEQVARSGTTVVTSDSAEARDAGGETPAPSPGAVELRPAERLRVLEGVPRRIEGSVLGFEVEAGPRRLDLARVEAVAVGAVSRPPGRPFLVVDLLLDSPMDGTGELRVLRFRSSSFDPRQVVGGDHPMESFVRMVESLLGASRGRALPNRERLRSPTARTFESIEEYQGEVLGVMA